MIYCPLRGRHEVRCSATSSIKAETPCPGCGKNILDRQAKNTVKNELYLTVKNEFVQTSKNASILDCQETIFLNSVKNEIKFEGECIQ